MKDRTRKIGLAIFLTIIFLILIIYLLLPKKKEYQSHLFYMNTYIDIKFETKKSGDQILEEIENIYNSKRWKCFDNLNKFIGRKK